MLDIASFIAVISDVLSSKPLYWKPKTINITKVMPYDTYVV